MGAATNGGARAAFSPHAAVEAVRLHPAIEAPIEVASARRPLTALALVLTPRPLVESRLNPWTPRPQSARLRFDDTHLLANIHRREWGASGADLARATIVSMAKNPQGGRMESHVVTLRLPGGDYVRGMFKPVDEQVYAQEVPEFFRERFPNPIVREIAASRLSDAMGFHLVPPTVPFTVDGRSGSLQLFVENSVRGDEWVGWTDRHSAIEAPRLSDSTHRIRSAQMAAFDFIVRRHDPHSLNWLARTVSPKKLHTIVSIDYGFSSPTDEFKARALPDTTLIRPWLRRTSLSTAAVALVGAGLEREAVIGDLHRLAVLRHHAGGPPVPPTESLDALATSAKKPAPNSLPPPKH